jgi:hypothetical protein
LGVRRWKQGETAELCDDEVSDLHSSTGILRVIISKGMRWTKPLALVVENCMHIFGVKSEGKRPLERPKRRREYDIKLILKPIEWKSINWINLAQKRESGGL